MLRKETARKQRELLAGLNIANRTEVTQMSFDDSYNDSEPFGNHAIHITDIDILCGVLGFASVEGFTIADILDVCHKMPEIHDIHTLESALVGAINLRRCVA